jgi:iron complex outermembrane receptor protein
MVYGMYATAYDPAAVGIFSVTPATTLALTSARILEAGLKFITPDQRTELTFAAYDIDRRNVYVALTNAVSTLAGEITTKGVDLAGGFRPVDHLKIWGNVALTDSQYGNFDVWIGNTPSNVAPLIINAGASRRFDLRNMRVTFRVRNLTNAVYAAWSDPGYPDQVYLGAPRTFELSASAKW